MNKADLINHIANETGWTKADATTALEQTLGAIKTGLRKDGTVALVGFGSFSVGKRAARTARNPRTGEEVKVPASLVPKFKPGTELKAAVA